MISIKASGSLTGTTNGMNGHHTGLSNDDSEEEYSEDEDAEEEDETFQRKVSKARAQNRVALFELFGNPDGKQRSKSARSAEVAKGKFLLFPETLQLNESDTATPTTPNYDLAVAQATENKDIQTIFFVNFPPKLSGAPQKKLIKVMESIQSWQSWSSTICEGKVQEQIDKKALPADSSAKSMMARSTYRSKVFDYLMRKSSWYVLNEMY